MTLKKLLFLLVSISFINTFSQEEEKVLFTINDKPVYSSEFLRVYNKNLSVVKDEDQKDMKKYLDLFVNYKLKIQDALDSGIDTIPSYLKELNTYKKQLIEPYLKDQKVVDKLVREAYERSKYEVRASHILIKTNPKKPNDTLKAYNKIVEARKKIVDGADFRTVAQDYSEDPSVKRNNGDLGYFKVFSMVYPFENAAFSTPVGEVSQPLRTKYGYHILLVDGKREAQGEIEAAHIMIKADKENAEAKIKDIHKQVVNGADFGYLAKTQSDDEFSAKKDGSLGKFTTGRMIKPFEDVAFALKNEGDVSKPFRTKFGWHIIKLIQKVPAKSFKEQKYELEQKIKRGERSRIINSSVVNKLLDKYKIEVDENAVNAFRVAWRNKLEAIPASVMKINGEDVSKNDLANFLGSNLLTDNNLKVFTDKKVMDYYKNHLHETNKEYASTLQEYTEGLLLFEVLQEMVWDKSKDSMDLANFYNANKNKYILPKRVEGTIASCLTKKCAKTVAKEFKKGKSAEEIKALINTDDSEVNVIFKSGKFDTENAALPKKYKFAKGVSKILKDQKNYVVVKATEILPSQQQELDAVRGKVISDYQEQLEKEWIEQLRSYYEIKMNEEELKRILK